MQSLNSVVDLEDIKAVARLAHEIWNEHFVAIIGQSQVDYMLAHFQSESAIASQLETGQEYYLLRLNAEAVGYLSLVVDQSNARMMISKIYIRRAARGAGLGQYLLDRVKSRCKKEGIDLIWLTVNRDNSESIEWYRKRGFKVTREVKKDIGGNYYMDDFVMEMSLDNGKNSR